MDCDKEQTNDASSCVQAIHCSHYIINFYGTLDTSDVHIKKLADYFMYCIVGTWNPHILHAKWVG